MCGGLGLGIQLKGWLARLVRRWRAVLAAPAEQGTPACVCGDKKRRWVELGRGARLREERTIAFFSRPALALFGQARLQSANESALKSQCEWLA